jgi:hypothetical protein
MLLIAASVLGDLRRWWSSHGVSVPPEEGDVGDLYDLLHRSAVEAEATWSLLPDRGDGSRVFTVLNGWLPISVLVLERADDLVVVDVRILRHS